jgi:hypothetical protein
MGVIDMHDVVGKANILFVTLDCLRFDVAQAAMLNGRTPEFARQLPDAGWEARETPGTFTLAAHLAFFHGFLPTPMSPGQHPRLFALEFEGSLTIAPTTFVFSSVENVIAGFHRIGYSSFCVGGVGFFNKKTPLGQVLPGFFNESVWEPELGVTAKDSTAAQVRTVIGWLESVRVSDKVLLFVNISATHPPHAHYLDGAKRDCPDSQVAALAYVDGQLSTLFDALRHRGEWFCLFMADHGEAHGEDGRWGHRIAHPTVTTVPLCSFLPPLISENRFAGSCASAPIRATSTAIRTRRRTAPSIGR